MTVQWEDPPPPARLRNGQWNDALEPLVDSPGSWARILVTDKPGRAGSIGQAIREGRTQRPAGRWETASRKTGDNEWMLWARYLGPEDETVEGPSKIRRTRQK